MLKVERRFLISALAIVLIFCTSWRTPGVSASAVEPLRNFNGDQIKTITNPLHFVVPYGKSNPCIM
jgi:hypothetical protein